MLSRCDPAFLPLFIFPDWIYFRTGPKVATTQPHLECLPPPLRKRVLLGYTSNVAINQTSRPSTVPSISLSAETAASLSTTETELETNVEVASHGRTVEMIADPTTMTTAGTEIRLGAETIVAHREHTRAEIIWKEVTPMIVLRPEWTYV